MLTAAGDLDTTFDSDGYLTTNLFALDTAAAVAVQPDGKIVLAGSVWTGSNWLFSVVRYNWDGSLDTTFDVDGAVTTDLGGEAHAYALAIQSNGKIVVAGSVRLGTGIGAHDDFALVRYNADGSLDTGFNGTGIAQTHFGPPSNSSEIVYGLAIQSDGKIVAAGTRTASGGMDFAVARYNSDGSLDTTFDSDGRVVTSFNTTDEAFGVAIQSDGKIIVVGHDGNYDFAAARYNTNGSLDTTFDGDGRVITDIGGSTDLAAAVAIQADGKIVLAGTAFNGTDYDIALVRYSATGSLDTSFDGDGKVITSFSTSHEGANAISILAGGKIVVAGYSQVGVNQDFALARYNSNGSLDSSFSGDGKLTTDFGTDGETALGLAIQPDGRVVAAGSIDSGADFLLVRYLSELNGDLDDDWDVDADDIDHLWNRIRNGVEDPGANDIEDLDSSGLVNEDDLDYLLANLVYTQAHGKVVSSYGDADLDGGVGGLDFTTWRLRAGTGWAHGDFDGDGGIGGLDFTLWRTRPTTYPGLVGSHGSAFAAMHESSTSSGGAETIELRAEPSEATLDADLPAMELATDEVLAASAMYRRRHLLQRPVLSSDAVGELLAREDR